MGSSIYAYFAMPPEKTMDLNSFFGQIAGVLLVLGYVCAVMMVSYIAIRYLIARPAEKAQLKTQLTYLMVGAVILTCGTTILGILSGTFTNMFWN